MGAESPGGVLSKDDLRRIFLNRMRRNFVKIDDWHEENTTSYSASEGSLLFAADAVSEPYQASHLVGYQLLTAVDHLHALKKVMVDAKSQHTFAPYTLIRGAIETASTALWILEEETPRAVARRALILESRGIYDELRAVKLVDTEAKIDEEEERAFKACLERHGFSPTEVRENPQISAIVQSVTSKYEHQNLSLTWQFCSAAAHGRKWAWRYLTRFEPEKDDGTSKVISGQLTSDEVMLSSALDSACAVVSQALKTRKRHSRNPLHTGASFKTSAKQCETATVIPLR